MQGKQTHQRELFSTIDLESFIPKDHLLRKVDKLLDLEFLYGLTERTLLYGQWTSFHRSSIVFSDAIDQLSVWN